MHAPGPYMQVLGVCMQVPGTCPPFWNLIKLRQKFGNEDMGTEGALERLVMDSSISRPPYRPHSHQKTGKIMLVCGLEEPEKPEPGILILVRYHMLEQLIGSQRPHPPGHSTA